VFTVGTLDTEAASMSVKGDEVFGRERHPPRDEGQEDGSSNKVFPVARCS
jgi:hypothetical protein